MAKRNWDRQETLVALNLYCRTPFGRLHAGNSEIVEISGRLNRTPSALAMKCCNLASLDSTLQSRGINGLRGTSNLDRQLWAEFERDPESVAFESEAAYADLIGQSMRTSESVIWENIQGLDRQTLTRVRVNQHFFRSIVLIGYQSQCAICELPFDALLVAAHIVPWSVDSSLRMNPRNGICLCNLHERAFDRGLLTIGEEYTIHVHSRVEEFSTIEAVNHNFLRFEGKQLRKPNRWLPDTAFLKRHSELVSGRF